MFTQYTGKETIHLLQNEHFIKLPDGSEQERITDSSFEILGRERKRYHVECQSTEDGSMIVRMFEYDTQLALENREVTAGALVVHFPDSAIVALRHTKNTPEVMTVMIRTPGGEVSYAVPVLKVRQYTVEEIFEKKLYFLIPFHIFVYEKSFKELEENSEKLAKLEEEYTAIVNRLEEDRKNGDLNEYEKVTILEMSDTVIKHLAAKYEKVRKGVGESMGGKVLEYEAKDILNRDMMQQIKGGKVDRVYICRMRQISGKERHLYSFFKRLMQHGVQVTAMEYSLRDRVNMFRLARRVERYATRKRRQLPW